MKTPYFDDLIGNLKKGKVAERQGFEPWVGSHRQRFSRPPHSTTLPPLRDQGSSWRVV